MDRSTRDFVARERSQIQMEGLGESSPKAVEDESVDSARVHPSREADILLWPLVLFAQYSTRRLERSVAVRARRKSR